MRYMRQFWIWIVVGLSVCVHANAFSPQVDRYEVTKADGSDGGSTTMVTLYGQGFGEKPQPEPVLWVFGNDVRQNGTPIEDPPFQIGENVGDTGPEVWDHVDPAVVYSSETRYAGLEHSYHTSEDGTVRNPLAFGGKNPPYTDIVYVHARMKPSGELHKYFQVAFTNIGTTQFDTGQTPWDKGELYDVVSSEGSGSGRIVNVDRANSRLTVRAHSTDYPTGFPGGTVTGRTSGATLEWDASTSLALHPGKYLRMWSGGKPGMYNTINISGNIIAGYRDSNGNDVARQSVGDIANIGDKLDWRLMEAVVSQKGTSAWGYYDVDNISRSYYKNMDIEGHKLLDRSPTISQLGLDAAGGRKTISGGLHFGEIYFDKTPQRIMLSNEGTYSNAGNELEIQYPKKWSDEGLTFELRKGALDITNDLYIYIFNEESVPNEDGVAICITCELVAPEKTDIEAK